MYPGLREVPLDKPGFPDILPCSSVPVSEPGRSPPSSAQNLLQNRGPGKQQKESEILRKIKLFHFFFMTVQLEIQWETDRA